VKERKKDRKKERKKDRMPQKCTQFHENEAGNCLINFNLCYSRSRGGSQVAGGEWGSSKCPVTEWFHTTVYGCPGKP
jgi:hypothetical protein